MAMVIPENAPSFTMFYIQARGKGINIKSRYKGVGISIYKTGYYYWSVQITQPDGKKYTAHFPFTREGEKQAYRRYSSKCLEFGYDPMVGKPNMRNAKKNNEIVS